MFSRLALGEQMLAMLVKNPQDQTASEKKDCNPHCVPNSEFVFFFFYLVYGRC